MSETALLIYIFGAFTAGSALAVVLVRNMLHAAFCLLGTLLGVAALYVLLFADLLAVVQLMVYVGGVLALIIFGIMLASPKGLLTAERHNQYLGWLFTLLVFGGLVLLIAKSEPFFAGLQVQTAPAFYTTMVRQMGIGLLSRYLLPFELVSVLLLMALVGAAYIASPVTRQEQSDLPSPNTF